jgi:hypothetical protein
MVRLRPLLVAIATGGMVIASVTADHAAATNPVGVWEMNEAAGARVMPDSSGHGLDGTIGTEVAPGNTVDGATGYRFARLTPNQPPAHPEHIVTVPDNASLDPGTRDYAVTIRIRMTAKFGNIIQKGQSGAKGGYFKFQNPGGVVQCLFRGSTGSIAVGSGRTLNDGLWHTIRCERTTAGVTMMVDGVLAARHNGATGSISNTWPLSIGGKVNCDQIQVTCDYFAGTIDRVQIDAG